VKTTLLFGYFFAQTCHLDEGEITLVDRQRLEILIAEFRVSLIYTTGNYLII